jgi:hypothetical protein
VERSETGPNDPNAANVVNGVTLQPSTYRSVWPWALCLALLSVACDVKVGEGGLSLDVAVGKATDEWRRTYTVAPGGRLEIVNTNGQIHVSGSTGSEVEVLAMREVRARSEEAAREVLRASDILEEIAPDRVSVRTPENREGGRRSQILVRYEVRIPPGLNVVLKTQNGEVRLENTEGRFTAAATNGRVTGSGVAGSVEASTVNGNIQMDLREVTDQTRLVTVNGSVRLTVPPAIAADVDASVVNGTVLVEDGLALEASERSRQRVEGRLNGGGPRIVVQTTNGSIRVRASP